MKTSSLCSLFSCRPSHSFWMSSKPWLTISLVFICSSYYTTLESKYSNPVPLLSKSFSIFKPFVLCADFGMLWNALFLTSTSLRPYPSAESTGVSPPRCLPQPLKPSPSIPSITLVLVTIWGWSEGLLNPHENSTYCEVQYRCETATLFSLHYYFCFTCYVFVLSSPSLTL